MDSPDPIGFDGGDWNLFGYVGNMPIGEVDPEGLAGPFLVVGGVGIVILLLGGSGYTLHCALQGYNSALPFMGNDKLQHCLASCLITRCLRYFGPLAPGVATVVGAANEGRQVFTGGSPEAADQAANVKGISLAGRPGSCRNQCQRAYPPPSPYKRPCPPPRLPLDTDLTAPWMPPTVGGVNPGILSRGNPRDIWVWENGRWNLYPHRPRRRRK